MRPAVSSEPYEARKALCEKLISVSQTWKGGATYPAVLLRVLLRQAPDAEPLTAQELALAAAAEKPTSAPLATDEQAKDWLKNHWPKVEKLAADQAAVIADAAVECGATDIPQPTVESPQLSGRGNRQRYQLRWGPLPNTTGRGRGLPQAGPIPFYRTEVVQRGPVSRLLGRGVPMRGWILASFSTFVAVSMIVAALVGLALFSLLLTNVTTGQAATIVVLFVELAWTFYVSAVPLLAIAYLRVARAPWWMQSGDRDLVLEWHTTQLWPAKELLLSRFRATCPTCGGQLHLEQRGFFDMTVVARCAQAPLQHVVSFDPITQSGRQLLP